MIPQIQPWIDDAELQELTRVIASTFITEAALTKEFEQMTQQLTGAKYVIAVANGTVGLYCALKALNIGAGDEVIVPDLTFIATANAVIMAGATPVFCDVESKTFCIDIASAKSKITAKTKAIMPVHLYGQSADMPAVMKLAGEHGLKVIEDAAQGVGVLLDGKHAGTFGDIGILSYYGNKTITTAEGGIILTNDEELAKKCYRLKNHGRDTKGTFIHEHIGFNFSFTELQAAIGVAQMKKLDKIIARKKEIHDKYEQELAGIPGFESLYVNPAVRPVFWFTSYWVEKLEELAEFLKNNGVQTRRFFYPLHLQPCYQDPSLGIAADPEDFKATTNAYNHGLSLPSSYLLTTEEQDTVIKKIKEFYADRN
ncbi:aminotransferase class I/II-fold pyridoxal phosphate-dependent enzyme [Chitinophaga sp. SYP-B3965]|uniref:DegT/DnrJ/EryC1/StrS family aminotransferase n=1 Tax=Chitinophaga sp. SYP-B3965 TaxID=2663120 RepID=UPI001299DD44|nr:DegT/DnrJ/EryC1/StrS family aminotransferase [Chitinophaga sp. SYP-B3965]MRG46923.1 aminotransferase class I/II-fold pyridoxal phosphate-dependent enzyme [Chitinophaga sp. SYP-B3965]